MTVVPLDKPVIVTYPVRLTLDAEMVISSALWLISLMMESLLTFKAIPLSLASIDDCCLIVTAFMLA